MDNSGIFKLLASAYDFFQKKNAKNDTPKEDKITETPSDALSRLLNFSKPTDSQQEVPPPPPKKEKPLQEKMLSTMKNHDEFVNRVLSKNKKV